MINEAIAKGISDDLLEKNRSPVVWFRLVEIMNTYSLDDIRRMLPVVIRIIQHHDIVVSDKLFLNTTRNFCNKTFDGVLEAMNKNPMAKDKDAETFANMEFYFKLLYAEMLADPSDSAPQVLH